MLDVLKSKTENIDARTELHRRGLDFVGSRIRHLLRKLCGKPEC